MTKCTENDKKMCNLRFDIEDNTELTKEKNTTGRFVHYLKRSF